MEYLFAVLYGYPGDRVFKPFTSLETVQAFVGGLPCPYTVFDYDVESGEYLEFSESYTKLFWS